ncbi:MAG: alkaline phosphatase family protein [Thermoprotei archaeon]|nr:alkaline phosphatase family protein [Thermoprotei archaeon]
MKILYVVLDGAPDGFNAPRRVLDEAYKPNLDSLASACLSGLMYPVGPGVAPESDVAVMSLLGYDPQVYYTGRGPLEALGAGVSFYEGCVAFRANFATVDRETLRIIDRRVGRSLSSWEAREIAKALDGMSLSGGEARAVFKATVGHRAVLVLCGGRKLSASVSNSDPAYERRGLISVALKTFENKVAEVKPLEDTLEAEFTAELANEFTRRALEILEDHAVNKEREARGLPKANAVLLRDAGDRRPPAEPISGKFGLKFTAIAEMPVEIGIARALSINVESVDVEAYASKPQLLEAEALKSIEALEFSDAVYVHLKGPDEPGHDGDFEGKVRAVEDIDRYFFKIVLDKLDFRNVLVIVTSDHSTPWNLKAHSDDPVPVMISHPRLGDKRRRFSELEFKGGSLGLIDAGYKLLPTVVNVVRDLS